MTVSMRKMSAGEGYKYLLRSVVSGDGNRSLLDAADPLLRRGGHAARRLDGLGRHRVRRRRDHRRQHGVRAAAGRS